MTLGFETILPFLRPIEHLIRDDSISEIMVNGSDRIFIERAGVLEQVPDLALSEKSLMVAVKNIARRLGDDISESKPILDSRLPDGSRVAAVIPPCSVHGVTLTIRKFNSRHFTVEDLVRMGTLDSELANRLQGYVQNRQNILISGGTGTGKTTLLNALCRFIPGEERILLIEDTSEIRLERSNLVRFEARQAQSDLPAITIRDLLKASLRHRPDRIILGEIRGGEAFDLLQLLNTGHSGTLSTVHASSAVQALARFTSCVLQSGIELPYRAIKSNIADSLNVLIQLERRPGKRFIAEVLEIRGYNPEADLYNLSLVENYQRFVATSIRQVPNNKWSGHMRKLKLQMSVTADGFVAGPEGQLDWMTWNMDESLLAFITHLADTSDTILLGRKMTPGFIQYWENEITKPEGPQYPFAQKMVDIPKIAFSKTLNHVDGKNIQVENRDLNEVVSQLKRLPGKDMIVYGGATFVSSLIENGLIDELNLFVNPVAIGNGMRIFTDRRPLTLISSTAYPCGIVVNSYRPK